VQFFLEFLLCKCRTSEFLTKVKKDFFPIMPILWPCVIATVLVTYKPAAFLTSKLTQEGDSFHAVVTPMEPLVKPVA
jgi:hypothetical protein